MAIGQLAKIKYRFFLCSQNFEDIYKIHKDMKSMKCQKDTWKWTLNNEHNKRITDLTMKWDEEQLNFNLF